MNSITLCTLEKVFTIKVFCSDQKDVILCWCKVRGIWLAGREQSFSNVSMCYSCSIWSCLVIGEEIIFLVMSVRFKTLWTRCSCWRHKCAFIALLCFKNSKRTIPQWPHHTHNINFLQWRSAFGVGCGNISLLIHCVLR